jgi:hypothetical protein
MAEQEGKRLELLRKLLPNFSRVAVLSNPSNPYCAIAVGEARRGATALNLEFDLLEASDARLGGLEIKLLPSIRGLHSITPR